MDLFNLLNVKHTTKKHMIYYVDWGIVQLMNQVSLQFTCHIVNVTNFLFGSADELMTIDNGSWIFLHLYVIQGWN